MKKFILYISFLFAAFTAAAQAPVEGEMNIKKEEKIKALYVAYMTQQLQLTPAEAQTFWPMHTQYDAELRAIHTGTDNELDRQQAALNVKKKYQAGFNRTIGIERTNNFYRQDAEFRKKLVERLRQMKQKRQGLQPGEQGMRQSGGMRRQGNRN